MLKKISEENENERKYNWKQGGKNGGNHGWRKR